MLPQSYDLRDSKQEASMLVSVRGVYRDGKIELRDKLPAVTASEVIVTFLANEPRIELTAYGLTRPQVLELRERLATFEDDWNAPGMEAYDNL
jgi:hypothetical protein